MNKKVLITIFIAASVMLTACARLYDGFAEFYALRIYPFFAETVSFFTSKIKFSLAEFIIIALIAAGVAFLSVTVFRTASDKSMSHLKNFFVNTVLVVSVILFTFVLFCGINYHRYEFAYYSGLEIKESSEEELINLCKQLIKDANNLREGLDTGEQNTAKLFDENYYETAERAKISFDSLSQKYKVLEGNYPQPKLVTFSNVMSNMRITGMFFPFTFEANVNKNVPPYQLPSTMLHELVHLRGFMREDEANFISYLACMSSGYDDFAYSGTMLALSYSMNALYREDYNAYTNLIEMYSEKVKNDMRYSTSYWKRYETKVAEISTKINDGYLKSNNQKDGVKSYGRMVDLLLAYFS
ncbi:MULTISPECIES: DUF3810 domain-containing protein [unclassified Sedimentibacter]|uniref:DUF3810 domain-containing protein n=1 Tax=unclassified Sedimentibacter TaxID=2649220 RepID=UPI0027DF9EA9|nr:DUF3810 domain-containing protein [Sedimentibacter sp. MB35-C1]WMJ78131.1 DUF3810 domain-containing protein [Sedimentibacter sp. MB35-C1]